MKKPRQLKLMNAGDVKLGRATIMDRALAARYGADYVHLAAFAIDIDRVREHEEQRVRPRGEPALPFAWEVYLTEAQISRLLDTSKYNPAPMLEEMCLSILELPRPLPGQAGALGSQLPFAIYTAVGRDILPASLGQCFALWKKPPVDLIEDVEAMEKQPGTLARLARHCLVVALEPPLVGPVREALTALTAEPDEASGH